MTTVTQLIDRALVPMRDTNKEFFSDAEMIGYINEAIEDLCARERLVRETATVVSAAGGLAIAADVLQVRWAKAPTGEEVAWMDETTFFDYQKREPTWPATTPLATIYDDTIWLHPAPANGQNWTVGYYGLPAALTAVGNTFPLRRIWERKAIAWMQYKMFARLDEPQLSQNAHQDYEAGLRPAQAVTDHQVPGRINLAREPNAFDDDPQAIHRGV